MFVPAKTALITSNRATASRMPVTSQAFNLSARAPLRPVSGPAYSNQCGWLQLKFHHHPYPDKVAYVAMASCLCHGFSFGFHLSTRITSLQSTSGNLPCASFNPQIIDKYLHLEMSKGRVLGLFPQQLLWEDLNLL